MCKISWKYAQWNRLCGKSDCILCVVHTALQKVMWCTGGVMSLVVNNFRAILQCTWVKLVDRCAPYWLRIKAYRHVFPFQLHTSSIHIRKFMFKVSINWFDSTPDSADFGWKYPPRWHEQWKNKNINTKSIMSRNILLYNIIFIALLSLVELYVRICCFYSSGVSKEL